MIDEFDDSESPSVAYNDGINDVFVKPNLDIISKYRINKISLSGTRNNYTFAIATRDGFSVLFKTSLSILPESETASIVTDGKIPELELVPSELFEDFEAPPFEVYSSAESEDIVTSQFTKQQLGALLQACFDEALVGLEKQNSHVIHARTSWYGDTHPEQPVDNGYHHEVVINKDR
ncbi:hypothetical protein [Vibrio mediterranei]|uniref:hypothetical protein n=1 Tax=Vibrio mediterranei TaxID=689 RepID=UPI0040676020